MALDGLGEAAGYLLILCAVLLMAGYFARQAAAVASLMAWAAYFAFALPRGPWPIRNGGTETLLYGLIFLCLAVAVSGAWSLDYWFKRAPADAYLARDPLRHNQPSSDNAPLPR